MYKLCIEDSYYGQHIQKDIIINKEVISQNSTLWAKIQNDINSIGVREVPTLTEFSVCNT